MQKSLLKWYEIHGRHDLPWRNTKEIYHVYLSEIMLQQTQVNRVKEEYYFQFLEKFPTLEALAQAQLNEVLSMWSGLGYYSRARNLHATAQQSFNNFPTSQKELLKLPGIGRYTASAICCFGDEQNIPVVDTNIARVLKRYFGLIEPKENTLWSYAASFVNNEKPKEHNLALMDLGSLVCLAKNPKCSACPLEKECLGKTEPHLYTQSKKKEYVNMELFYALWIKENKIALQRSKGPMYKNMLILPQTDPIEENFIGEFKHAYTKYRLKVKLYKKENMALEEVEWVELDKIENAPISSLTKKALSFV